MAFLRRKKPNIRVPTGKDAVNFRKLLFLPIKDTEDLLTNQAWERLDLRSLTLMKTKMLRASCIARGLPKKGGKRTLVQRLTASLTEQRTAEILRRQEEEEEYQRQLDMLGGVWSFGSGFAGQLGHGDLESSATPRIIKKLRGRSIAHVYAGFDSDVAFAVSRTGDVYVWGKRTSPTGLPPGSSLAALTKLTYGHDSDLDPSDEEGEEGREARPTNQLSKKENSDELKRERFSPTEKIEEERDEGEDPNESDDEDEEGGDEDFVHPVKLLALCGEGVSHIAISCGAMHAGLVTTDGQAYTWGSGDGD
ncbi:P-type ATPase (P-ATPase) Superfamily [Phytophthora cinnamomi]|uniref:P-type ATPase (P-ATPase) Superfamily n=1 Tax=Phytophthora cinnamomi TaxID=4785 RepID=UPI003559B5F2|nr:P-type ATPase (P-ATPase) Superfamily [Phytophthora cinnamomi]